jgi:hypothetical protein
MTGECPAAAVPRRATGVRLRGLRVHVPRAAQVPQRRQEGLHQQRLLQVIIIIFSGNQLILS